MAEELPPDSGLPLVRGREANVGVTTVHRHEELRRMRGLSVARLAGALGAPTRRVYSIERGEVAASQEYRRAFCRLFRVRDKEVFDAEGWVI
jgi:DNA-binding XRE family transcriptional regulator